MKGAARPLALRWFGYTSVGIGLLGVMQLSTIALGQIAPDIPPTVSSIMFCLAVMAMSFSSTAAPWLVVVLWSAADIATIIHSGVVQWVPSTCMAAVALAVGRLAYRNVWCGAVAAMMPTISAMTLNIGQNGSPIWTIATLLQNGVWYGSAAGVGALLFRYRALQLAERRRRSLALREDVMERLHDSIANELSFAAALLDRTADSSHDGRDCLALEARPVVHRALDQIRELIDWLQTADDEPDDIAADTTSGTWLSSGILPRRHVHSASVTGVMNDGDTHLATLGFIGESLLICTRDDGLADADVELLVPFLREMYGNIASHADSEGGYALSVACAPGTIRVCVSDRSRDGAEHTPRHGFGLERYRRRIEGIGGIFRIGQIDENWTLLAVIPRSSAGAPPGCADRR